jgi:putative transposase
MLNVLDEFTRECLAIRVRRRLNIAIGVRRWIAAVGAHTAYLEPGSPWENGYCESFNARLRNELLDGEIFHSLKEAQTVIETCRRHYNTARPRSALGYRPPAPETVPWPPVPASSRRARAATRTMVRDPQ